MEYNPSSVVTSESGCVVFEECDRCHGTELSDCELQQKYRYAEAKQHDGVRYQEGAAAVLVAEVGEPPHVTQTCRTQARRCWTGSRLHCYQHISHLISPCMTNEQFSLISILLLSDLHEWML